MDGGGIGLDVETEGCGWALGVCHDSASASIGTCTPAAYNGCATLGCPNVSCTNDVLTAHNGNTADYVSTRVCSDVVAQALVVDMQGGINIPPKDRFKLLRITYVLMADTASMSSCTAQPCTGGGPVTVAFTANTTTCVPAVQDGITLTRSSASANGDVNADGSIDIGDAICVLGCLFAKGPAPVPIACTNGSIPATGQTLC